MIDSFLKEFKNNICIKCKSNCNEGVHISRINNNIILKCLEFQDNNKTVEITLKKEINKEGI